MELEHSFTIPVPPEQAYQVLLDVEKVAPCMPGATIDSVDGDEIKGRIKVKVGPVSLTYSGTAHFTERDEAARSVTLEASGKETRGAGTASATVRSTLIDEGGGQTKVVVHTTLSVTGRPAQFGRGVMAEVGGRIIERFAANLAAQLAGGSLPEAGPSTLNGAGPAGTTPGPPASAAAPAAGAAPAGRGMSGAVPLEELNLPVRAYNSLRREGIHSVADLSARTEVELLAIENLGPQSVSQIKQRLADLGVHLASQPGDGHAAATASQAATGTTTVTEANGAPAQATRSPRAEESAPRGARPPDEDAIDLLSVAGFPVLKRALPVVGALVALLLIALGARRRTRRRAA